MKKYRNLILFLLGSFLISFIAMVTQAMLSNYLICFAFYGIQAAAPTISAVAVLCINKNFKTHFALIFRKEHLGMAIFLPFIIACTTMLSAKIIFCIMFGKIFTLESISTTQFIIIMWSLVAEEIGWRGYLEPLLKTYGVHSMLIPCIVGVIWCLWHYHFFLQNSIEVPIPLFFISCIIESYIYSFLINVTNNILSAMTYHFFWNLMIHIAQNNPIDNNGNVFPYIILIILEALAVFIFWCLKKRKSKTSSYLAYENSDLCE